MKDIRALLPAALLLLSAGALAQNTITVDASFMTRGEIRRGALPAGTKDGEDGVGPDFANFSVERTMLGFDYTGEGLEVRLTAQHSGTWGSKEGGSFNVYEAWTKLSSKPGFFVKVGRQNISYDDQRIFGSDNWSMTGMSHDALKAGYEGHGHKIHLLGAYNQNPENMNGGTFFTGGLQPYKAMEAAWYHYDIPKTNIGVSLLFMNAGMQGGEKDLDEKTYQQQIYGTYISFTPKKWNVEAAYYRQGGYDETSLPIDAWMGSLKVTYNHSDKLTLYSGFDYLSGDSYFATPAEGQVGMVRHDKIRGFSSIYGSHHKFYGAMDFFYVTAYYRGFTPGLENAFAGITWKPWKKFTTDLSYHYLTTATQLENARKALGYEFEFSASYAVHKDAKLSVGCSYMRGTETMVILKRTSGNRQLQWGWVMLSVTPRLFSNGK